MFSILKANRFFILVIVLLNFVVFSPVLFNDFVSADDRAGYVENSSLLNLGNNMKTGQIGSITFSFLKNTVGNNPFPIHLLSLVLHTFITILVFLFTYLVFRKNVSAIATLLFAIHPVNVEPVAWMSAAGYLFSTLFLLIPLLLYVNYKENNDKRYVAASLLVYIIGIFTTTSVWLFSLPIIILALEFFIWDKKIDLHKIVKTIPYFVVIGFTYFAFIGQLSSERINILQTTYNFNSADSTPWLNRLPYTFYMIFKLLLFPDHLSIFHEGQIIGESFYTFMILFTIALIPLLFILLKRSRIAAGLLLLILIPMYPTFSPVQVAFFIAERYLYVSSIFFSILVAITLLSIQTKIGDKYKHFALVATLLILSAYGAKTFTRTMDWKNSRALWEATSKTAPLSPRVFNNLGDAYSTEGNEDAAIGAFSRAVEINPNYVEAIHNLGTVYVKIGQYEIAEQFFKKALEINPQYEGAEKARQILEALQKRTQNTTGQE